MAQYSHRLVCSPVCSLSTPYNYEFILFFGWNSVFPPTLQGADKIIKLWDAYTGHIIQTLEGHMLGISDIAWSYDTEYIASASDDKTIRIWSLDLVCNSFIKLCALWLMPCL